MTLLTCREFADFIADYASGELSPDAQRRFQEHLDVCPNCQRYLRSYEETITLGKRAFDDGDQIPASVPEDLIQAVLKAREK